MHCYRLRHPSQTIGKNQYGYIWLHSFIYCLSFPRSIEKLHFIHVSFVRGRTFSPPNEWFIKGGKFPSFVW
ncbi:unnamed protein product, partial [Candidula unifasciata]